MFKSPSDCLHMIVQVTCFFFCFFFGGGGGGQTVFPHQVCHDIGGDIINWLAAHLPPWVLYKLTALKSRPVMINASRLPEIER